MTDPAGDSMDNRLRQLEVWVAGHEAKCSERYRSIEANTTQINLIVNDTKNILQRRMDWLLAAVITMAVSSVIGVENFGQFLSFIRGAG